MLRSHRAFLAVAGAGSVLSMAHYLAKVRSITGQVPVHFNLFGVPDGTAAPWAFIMYPIVSVGMTAVMVYTALAPNARAVLPHNSAEQVSTGVALLCAKIAVLACQYYAVRIAEGSAERLPSPLMYVLYGTLTAASAAVLTTKNPSPA
ncbi:unspecified product [Leishmania tarentolae]|uniref:Unspecified product n=1 Tax=Leishmania tarentolae TaxID=5689 RepID=A0A640KRC5_LEITA|nr:unspecified product [Leishmania tarentolae]